MTRKIKPTKPASPRVASTPSNLVKTSLGTKTDPSMARRIKKTASTIL